MSVSVLFELKDKIDMYFGTGSIGILFVCALLLWMVRKEKSNQMRFYVYYVVTAFVAMFNPVSLFVLDKTGHMEVFERFFWLLMTTFLIAFTVAILTEKKKMLFLPLLLLLFLCGQSVFTDTEYKPAENAEKISQEAIEVSDIILRDYRGLSADEEIVPNLTGVKAPRAVVTEPLCEDIRMYNANIRLWYVRKNFGNFFTKRYNKLASLMTMDNEAIPVKTLTARMRARKFDYFVLGNWQTLTGDVDAYDIAIIGQTENYRVYKYDRPPRYRMTQFADVNDYQCMSYLITDGKGGMIVVDGGRAWQSEALVNEIKKRGGVVHTWIITHPHDDHCGVLASVLEAEWDKTEIEIGQILIGEMDYDEVQARNERGKDTYSYLLMGLERFGNVRWLSAGDELEILGLKMKVLHTCNQTVLDHSDNIMNDGSMVFKLSGQSKSVLFLADTADNSAEIAAQVSDYSQGSEIGRLIADEILANYPDDVKSDVVQMSHHGNGSYPDYFYEAIAPRAAFFAAPDWLMENKNKDTGEPSYYSTPHYVELMERLGARIISYSSEKNYVKFR